jgi:hypothetical protein
MVDYAGQAVSGKAANRLPRRCGERDLQRRDRLIVEASDHRRRVGRVGQQMPRQRVRMEIITGADPIAVASVCGICLSAKRGAHGARAGTDGAGNTLAADNLDTGLARVQVIDMTLPMAFRAVTSVPGHARLACGSGTFVGAASIAMLEAWPGIGRE